MSLFSPPPTTHILGATTTINFPTPDITAADLGIRGSHLSLVIPDNKLPTVVIPADSPFHTLTDAWHVTELLFAQGPEAREKINLDIGKLRLAEANDLLKRGKTQEAQDIMTSVQNGLTVLSKDSATQSDVSSQTDIQAISETRFSLLGNQLQNAQGNAKLALIKQIATQAKDTIQQVQPNIPEAVNATNPTQKPLIGTVVNSTPTEITVKTAGGQEITVPTNTNMLTVEEKQMLSPTPAESPTPNDNDTSTSSSDISPTTSSAKSSPQVGSTIALIGSTVNNHFSPSIMLTNVPKELAAPAPVTVAKVDIIHNTMIVEENGVYTQVDINKQTTIKGADTNVPLTSIQPGDVVVVHGQPLTPTAPTNPSIAQPLIIPSAPPQPDISPSINAPASSPTPTPSAAPSMVSSDDNAHTSPSLTPLSPVITSTGKKAGSPTITVTSKIVSPTTTTIQPSSRPTTPPTQPATPKVIQSTSIQIIEKKSDITSTPPKVAQPSPSQTTQSQPTQQSQPTHQDQPKAPPPTQNIAPTVVSEDKKK